MFPPPGFTNIVSYSCLTKVHHQNAETSSTSHTQTGKLIRGINDKLQQHITASAEITYSNVATHSKKAAGDDDEESQPGRTMVAVDALKTLCLTSMASIREVGLFCSSVFVRIFKPTTHRGSNGNNMTSRP